MILSNAEIFKALEKGHIVITPSPKAPSIDNTEDTVFDSTALDLRLGNEIRIPYQSETPPMAFDLSKGNIALLLNRIYDKHTIDEKTGFPLEPSQFALASTLEKIHLPIQKEGPCYAARVEGKSSYARCGLIVHFTAPTIHAGFKGIITLELMNLGPCPITLRTGLPICQIIFEQVQGEVIFSPSQFQDQATPSGLKFS